jgi:hypothetical protein
MVQNRKSSQELLGRLGVEDIVDVMKRGGLLWFGHVERKSTEDWVKVCRDLLVGGARSKDRGKKTWQECANEDMKQIGIRKYDAQDRTVWRGGVFERRLTSASTEKLTLN